MFTKKNFNTLVNVTNLAWFAGAIPYRFVKQSNGEQRIVGSFTKIRAYRTHFNLFISTLYILFIAFRFVHKLFISEGEASLGFLVKMGYLFFSYGLAVVLELHTIVYWEEMPQFLNLYIKFFKQMQAEFVPKSDKGLRCMKFFSGVMFISLGTLVQNIIHIRKHPHQEHFITSLLTDPKSTSGLVLYPIILLSIWIWCTTWIYIYVYCFHWYMYMALLFPNIFLLFPFIP